MKSLRTHAMIGLLLLGLAGAWTALWAEPAPTAAEPAAAAAGDEIPLEGGEITLEQIMADPDWIGNAPEDPYWSADGRTVYYERKRQGEQRKDLWRLPLAASSAPQKLGPAEKATAETGEGAFSRDRRLWVYVREGDVYVRDAVTGKTRQLTRTTVEESEPRFLAGDRRVSFRRGDAIFVRDLESGLESQPAELRLAEDPADKGKDPGFLEAAELRLFDVLKKRRAEKEANRREDAKAREVDSTLAALPWYLGDKVEILDSALSPTAEWMVVVVAAKAPDEGKEDNMPRFVTESGYVDVEQVRAKVGTGKPESPKLLLLDLRSHEKREIDLSVLPGIREDPLKELREKAAAAKKAAAAEKTGAAAAEASEEPSPEEERTRDQKEMRTEATGRTGVEAQAEEPPTSTVVAGPEEAAEEAGATEKTEEAKEEKPPELRVVEIANLTWSDDGRQLALQFFSWDNKDRWIARIDLPAGKLVPLARITDPAWINYDFNDVGWLPDNRTLWYLSEESGWPHLYVQPVDGARRQLTRGEFEVGSPVVSRDGSAFYLTANREHPGVQEVYRQRVAGGDLERLTHLEGLTSFVLSPDERRLLLLHSKVTRPPELYLQDARPGATARPLTDTVSAAFKAVRWSVPEVVAVPSTHAGRPIYSRVYTPAGWNADRRWPAVSFVHGAGYLQNAHKGWSTYFREFMFNSLLTRRGYVVIDMDYRASAGYGRDWRTAIYRQMGWPEVEDLEDGIAWLAAHRAVDPQRVGIYGGSYGGFLTFMSMFRKPDLFACGAALRPVADWAHYNHEYTANILNTPDVDPEAYRKSSPIEYAEGLAKPLLIAHGMVDDNVVFQDSVRLVQRLIELRKENFETAIYPVEPHGFKEPTSWLDEYRRVLKLFETWIGEGRSGK